MMDPLWMIPPFLVSFAINFLVKYLMVTDSVKHIMGKAGKDLKR